jgi:hypothetical protein
MRRLKKLVKALEALPDDIKNRKASENVNLPTNRDFKSFAGLIHIVAQNIPALKKHYPYKDEYDSKNGIVLKPSLRYTSNWEWALKRYLGANLVDWAGSNSELWGNDKIGYSRYFANLTFDMNGSEVLTNRHIINHLICVCNRYKSLSLKDKAALFIDNQGGLKVVFILTLSLGYIALIIYANIFPYNSLHFMAIWLSLTITTAIWNY